MSYTYWNYQRIAVMVLGGVFFTTLAISYAAYLVGKKRAKREMKQAEGYVFSSVG